jgi:hypothetical protein
VGAVPGDDAEALIQDIATALAACYIFYMGQAKAKQYSKKQFLKEHPHCVYCGNTANTTDHCPPRCFFSGRVWPEGFEFPACAACNASTRDDEQIAAVLVQAALRNYNPVHQKEWERLCDGVKNNYPEVVAEWQSGGEAARKRFFREAFGPKVGDEFRHAGYGTVRIGPLSRNALRRVAIKLGQALFYRHTERIFEGDIYVHQLDPFAKNLDKIMQTILTDILQMSGQSAPFGWRILHFEFGGMVNLSF